MGRTLVIFFFFFAKLAHLTGLRFWFMPCFRKSLIIIVIVLVYV